MDENKQKESTNVGCIFWSDIIFSSICTIFYWNKIIHSNYWPYLLVMWIVILLALIWWYFIRK